MIKRNVLLNPGPATTTDTVKNALVVPDICPREEEFVSVMREVEAGLLKVVHADPSEYTAVLFCGSGTLNMDVCLNSLLPAGKKALIINNGAYSSRAADICEYYGMPHINLRLPLNEPASVEKIEEVMSENDDIALVYTTHNETGTGLMNPIRELGAAIHRFGATFVVDTTSTYAMRPINIKEDNVDFLMASAQKGIMAMTGLSFVIGNIAKLEESKDFPKRSYYCNLYMQYEYAKKHGEMHFTPPVQLIYAAKKALEEYFAEGEEAKWERHYGVFRAEYDGLEKLGFRVYIPREKSVGLVVAALYPDDPNWDYKKVHDYCYERGFTIYPGKIDNMGMFRLCALGAITPKDIDDFFVVFREALDSLGIKTPVHYAD